MSVVKNKKIDELFARIETVFNFLFLTLALLSFNNLFAGHFALKVFSAIVVLFGVAILVHRLFSIKNYLKFYGVPLLIAVAVAYIISSLLTYKYGVVENAQALAWMTLHFGILYATDVTSPKDKGKAAYFGLLKFFVGYVTIANIAGIVMLLVGYGRNGATSFNGNLTGYLWGRLWGVYADPNIGSVLCVASIVISLYFLFTSKRKTTNILIVLNIVLSLCYISFSDSRTGLVCLGMVMFVYVCMLLKAKKPFLKNPFAYTVTVIAVAAVIALASMGSLTVIKKGYNQAVQIIYEIKNAHSGTTDQPGDENPSIDDAPNIIERPGNELEEDISNRRFHLWKSGVEVWSKSPVFGVSHRNIVPFALENTPDTYLVNNDMVGNFDTTHNAYIDVLVAQGIVGALPIAAFLVLIASLLFKTMLFSADNRKCTLENCLMLALVLTFATSAFFILEVMYINTAGAILFWLSLGRLVKNLKEKDDA